MGHPKILQAAAKPFGFVAALVLLFMMLFTTYAVFMNAIGQPVLGIIDVLELSLVFLIFIAMPGVFLRDENVTVDVIDQLVSRRARVFLRLMALVVTQAFLILMMVRMLEPALSKLDDGEVTMTLSINRFIHWVPILFGFALSILGTFWVFFHYLSRGVPKDPILDGEKNDNPGQPEQEHNPSAG